MSFEPASPISIIACDQCQGSGCSACDQHGVYALHDKQPISFNLPGFIDLKSRRQLKRLTFIKRSILLSIAIFLIILSLKLIYA